MKLKGVGFFEQHVEKLVLGGVALVLVVVIVLQFATEPNRVEVGNQVVPPARAFDRVAEEANRLSSSMRAASPALPEREPVSLLARYESALTPTGESPALSRALGRGIQLADVDVVEVDIEGATLVEVELPAPSDPMAAVTASTIDPITARRTPGLAALLPESQPFDKQSVSIETRIRGTAVRDAFSTDPGEDSGMRPIPSSWWRDGIEVLAVVAERQRQETDGSWGPSERVPTAPGRVDVLSLLPAEPRPADMVPVLDAARQQVRELVQPRYYPTIAGPRWQPPAEAARARQAMANAPEVRRLETRLNDLETRIADDEVRLEEAERAAGQPQDRREGDGGGRGVPQDRRDRQEGTERERTASPSVIRSRLDGLRNDRDRVMVQLEALGWRPASGDSDSVPEWQQISIQPFLDDDGLRAWMHDLSAEPGRTYRYRTRYVINNPVFGRGASLSADQQSLASEPTLSSDWSGWSEPVSVPFNEYFFVTSASEGDALGGARASVEVFRFYYGYWRRGTATLEPGDAIVTTVRLPDPALLPIFDLSSVRPDEAPAGQPGMDPGRPGDRDAAPPPGPGRGVPPPPGRGVPRDTAPPPDQPGQPGRVLDLPSEPGPSRLDVQIGFVLLDVATVPGGPRRAGEQSPHQVVVRSPLGSVELRRPDSDRQSVLFNTMTASAAQGETQGATPPEAETTPPPPGRDRVPPQGPGRNGGGGGGGGG
ncbi:MAG: hypothetical protein EA378_10070 [Phycisphaerales bacterium]|nr:MAG: hypothetical protein EA378_10070 [Phycisphaerales bacterium]